MLFDVGVYKFAETNNYIHDKIPDSYFAFVSWL